MERVDRYDRDKSYKALKERQIFRLFYIIPSRPFHLITLKQINCKFFVEWEIHAIEHEDNRLHTDRVAFCGRME